MSIETDTRDKVVRLEAIVEHQSQMIASLSDQLGAAVTKLDAMHDIFMKMDGAKLTFFALAGAIGFASAKLSALLPWFSIPPR